MKKSVLSLEEKTSHHWVFFTFKLLNNRLWLTELGGANIKHLTLLFEQAELKLFFFYFSEHQELSKEINEISDSRIREDMERELGGLVSRMEAKSLQISKIRRHQERASWKYVFAGHTCNKLFGHVLLDSLRNRYQGTVLLKHLRKL